MTAEDIGIIPADRCGPPGRMRGDNGTAFVAEVVYGSTWE
jgi:hypothetical protein